MATVAAAPPEQRFVLTDVSWGFYEYVLKELNDRPVRVTYDRGSLEFLAPSYPHERSGRTLGDLVLEIADALDQPIVRGGSTTFRRPEAKRGLEPDDCFWIRHAMQMVGKREMDLAIDPPPDLAIEIDVSRSSLDRMAIYATLRVPEVWRLEDDALHVYVLRPDGRYEPRDTSPTFPQIPLQNLIGFLRQSVEQDDITLRRGFRAWLRSVLPSDEDPERSSRATE